MIDTGEVDRIEAWVKEAVADGARVLTGGTRVGRSAYAPTVLDGVPEIAKVCAQEVFAPVVALYRFADFEDAVAAVNRSRYGLQAGVFTTSLPHTLMAFDRIEAGGVIVNDVPDLAHRPHAVRRREGLRRRPRRPALHHRGNDRAEAARDQHGDRVGSIGIRDPGFGNRDWGLAARQRGRCSTFRRSAVTRCHRISLLIVALSALWVSSPMSARQVPATAPPTAAPDAEAQRVLTRAREALGGVDRLAAVESLVVEGTRTRSPGSPYTEDDPVRLQAAAARPVPVSGQRVSAHARRRQFLDE